LVHLIRQFVDHNGRTIALVQLLHVRAGPDNDTTAPCAITLFYASRAVNNPLGWEVRTGDEFYQFIQAYFWPLQNGKARADDFTEVMGRYVGRHPDRDT